MTEAMPFLQKAILLSYDPRPFRRDFLLPSSVQYPLHLPGCPAPAASMISSAMLFSPFL